MWSMSFFELELCHHLSDNGFICNYFVSYYKVKYLFWFNIYRNDIFWRFNYDSSKKLAIPSFAAQGMLLSAYMKIFVNFSQSIQIINSLNLNWDYFASILFPVFKISSGGIHRMISLECLVQGNTFLMILFI